MMVLGMYQRDAALAKGLREGVDFRAYEQVPMGPGDRVISGDRFIDRRTTDGHVLAADGSNRK